MSYLRVRSLHYFDWVHFFFILCLSCIGLLFVFSATYTPEKHFSLFFIKQGMGLFLGLGAYFVCSFIPPKLLLRTAYFGYYLLIVLLIYTLVKGSVGMGGQRWVDVGFFKMQPSELAKLLFPAFFAYHFDYAYHAKLPRVQLFFPLCVVMILSFLLIAKQPDLGTACIVLFTGLSLLWVAGIGRPFFITLLIGGLIGSPILWFFLKPYQKNRIAVFLGYGDIKKERYQIEQAAIAIGSGGILGKGFLEGTQNKLRFIPESRTDFIFAVVGEEWGFVGSLFVLILYFLLFLRMYYMVITIPDPTMQLLLLGLELPMLFSTLINVGMVLNLFPVTGVPLPLFSYGLSHSLVSFAALGWIQGIGMRERD